MAEHLIVIAYLTARAGKEDGARKMLQALVAPTRLEAGCITYDLHEMHGDATRFVFYEIWRSAAVLEAHSKSAHMMAFREIRAEFLSGPTELTKWRKIE